MTVGSRTECQLSSTQSGHWFSQLCGTLFIALGIPTINEYSTARRYDSLARSGRSASFLLIHGKFLENASNLAMTQFSIIFAVHASHCNMKN